METLTITRVARAPLPLIAAILVGLTLLPLGGHAHGGEPPCALTVDPVSGPYDTAFVLTGSGFAPATAGTIVVSWADVFLGGLESQDYPVTTDGAGGFTLEILGPAAVPADYSATAEVSGCLASAAFTATVAPCRSAVSLTVVPEEPRAGEPFAILGAGWTSVDVRVEVSGIGIFQVFPDVAGAFELVLTAPDVAGATVDVSAGEFVGADEILLEDCHAATQFVLSAPPAASPTVTPEPTRPAQQQLPDTALGGNRSADVETWITDLGESASPLP